MDLVTLYIGTQPEPEDRTQIEITSRDAAEIEELPRGQSDQTAEVYDHRTGQTVSVRRASCGLSCWCALEFET